MYIKKLVMTFVVFAVCGSLNLFAQQTEKFDIISFKTPKGWQKEVSQSGVQFGAQKGDAMCLAMMFKAIPANADSKANFDASWETIVKDLVTVSGEPQMQPSASENGWTSQSGLAQYESDGQQGIVLLVTLSGGDKMVNVLILTNSDAFESDITGFLESIDLPKLAEISTPTVSVGDSSIIGTWGRGTSVTQPGGSFGRWSYVKQQYTFAANGEYSFIRKTYVEDDAETFLIIESGGYSISGNNLTLNPKSNVIEAWSKKNGGDNFNQLISRQKQALEKTTYQITFEQAYLVLLAGKETARDGRYNATNGWSFNSPPNYQPIKLPGQ